MSARVRAERFGDAAAVRAVLCAAFPTAEEADLVDQLRADGDAAIALVAEEAGEIVGHVLLSRMAVEADGRPLRALGLGPLAVLPARQRRGIGAALVREAIARARHAGEAMMFVVGDPAYYRRFGFTAEAAAAFASPYAGPHLMALALADIGVPQRGTAAYAPAFALVSGGAPSPAART